MKLLSALFSALVVVGFAGAAAAQCSGYGAKTQQSAEAPIVLPDGSAGS